MIGSEHRLRLTWLTLRSGASAAAGIATVPATNASAPAALPCPDACVDCWEWAALPISATPAARASRRLSEGGAACDAAGVQPSLGAVPLAASCSSYWLQARDALQTELHLLCVWKGCSLTAAGSLCRCASLPHASDWDTVCERGDQACKTKMLTILVSLWATRLPTTSVCVRISRT